MKTQSSNRRARRLRSAGIILKAALAAALAGLLLARFAQIDAGAPGDPCRTVGTASAGQRHC